MLQRKYDAVQHCVATLGDTLEQADPDVVVVLGDDQGELYRETNIPAISVYWGDSVLDIPRDMTHVPASRAAAMWAKHAEQEEEYPVASDLARHVIESAIGEGFDVAQMADQPDGRSIGHAFTFVRLRLMRERIIPMIPVMLNTYFPPNQPTAARCYGFGKALGRAIAAWPEDTKVAIIASGGLSHFVVDEALDRGVLDALAKDAGDALGAIPEGSLQSGSSEIKNWIVVAGAMSGSGLTFDVIDYVPGYRTAAGTGCGMAFARWV